MNLIAQLPPAEGTLFFIDNSVDTLTGTVMLKATFPNTERLALGGAVRGDHAASLRREKRARGAERGGRDGAAGDVRVRHRQRNTAQQRKVSVERTEGNVSVITAGLRDGEQVVRSGQSRLTAGAKVKVATAADSANANAGAARADSGSGARRGGAGGKGTGGRRKPATS